MAKPLLRRPLKASSIQRHAYSTFFFISSRRLRCNRGASFLNKDFICSYLSGVIQLFFADDARHRDRFLEDDVDGELRDGFKAMDLSLQSSLADESDFIDVLDTGDTGDIGRCILEGAVMSGADDDDDDDDEVEEEE